MLYKHGLYFFYSGEYVYVEAIERRNKSSLYYQENGYTSIINFATVIMFHQEKNIGEQCLRFNIILWKNQGSFHAFNDISDHLTLLQLMDSIGIINNAVSIFGKWIFDSNLIKIYCYRYNHLTSYYHLPMEKKLHCLRQCSILSGT